MNQQLLEIQRYNKEKFNLDFPVRQFDNGSEYITFHYTGKAPLKRNVSVYIQGINRYTRLHAYLSIKIQPEKRGEALELVNYINSEYHCARARLGDDDDIWFFAYIPTKIPLSELGPLSDELAEEIRDLVRQHDARFRLLAAPAAPAPTETKKRSANDPDDRWSVDFG